MASPLPRINLIARDNGVGLSRDLALLAAALRSAGYRVDITGIRGGKLTKWLRPWIKRLQWRVRRLRGAARARTHDINLMLEHVWADDLPFARYNALVPNPEWFHPRDQRHLGMIDLVLAKTFNTEALFRPLGAPVVYTGFTSEDRRDPDTPRRRSFFHLAGRSHSKGTEPLLALWRRHPEWPLLTVVQNPRSATPGAPAANIAHQVGYLDDAQLRTLQNTHRFHLCPSETEGYGHYVIEALGVGAVTVTVDAPPMNELVTDERGLLVAVKAETGTQSLATTYFFDEASMEAAVQQLIAMEESEIQRRSAAARAWFERNDREFHGRLVEAVVMLGR